MIRRRVLGLLIVSLVGFMLIDLVAEMPEFGSSTSPSYTQTIPRFFENSLEDTGAINMVTSIILDYRAFDTLGEATVLFT
jgi:multisubunit Na+/H+ antiporter MnhB subunit